MFAVSGWRLGTQKGSYVVTLSRPYLAKIFPPPATRIDASHFCTFAQEHRSDLHLCISSLINRASVPLVYLLALALALALALLSFHRCEN